ncbi:hypothetical protein HNR46_002826 [Haloferula luteola]|uniref:Uncharacterized protein n=1 Tax=Haloferula luteola TaxID=595692 RepID=A0A840VFI7_9BACT|nr:hypothetical protein [Haloferula luteola]MBB5352580.1 hypothetical protein [Haloferula luteola]
MLTKYKTGMTQGPISAIRRPASGDTYALLFWCVDKEGDFDELWTEDMIYSVSDLFGMEDTCFGDYDIRNVIPENVSLKGWLAPIVLTKGWDLVGGLFLGGHARRFGFRMIEIAAACVCETKSISKFVSTQQCTDQAQIRGLKILLQLVEQRSQMVFVMQIGGWDYVEDGEGFENQDGWRASGFPISERAMGLIGERCS